MFTLNIRNIVAVGKGGVKWDTLSSSPSSSPSVNPDPVKRAEQLLKEIRESNFSKSKELKELGDILKNLDNSNTTKKTELKSLLQTELSKETRPQMLDYTKQTYDQYYNLPTEGDKKNIQALLTSWDNDFKEASVNQNVVKEIRTTSKNNQETLNKQALENADFVRKFGNRVNLGAVVPFIENQSGASTNNKIQAAFDKAKSNTNRSDAGKTVDINSEYSMKSKLNGQGIHLSEYNALTSLLESMLKSPAIFDNLKSQNIPQDRKVDGNILTDLFADLDDDGVIEAVNGVNDTGIWKKFKGLFVDNDAMQSEYFGEQQAASKMKDEAALRDMLKTINVEQGSGEDLKVFAKRARAALLMSASISGTAELDPKSALARMQKSNEYSNERGKIEKQIAEIQKKILDTNNITAENANKIARSFASVVTSYTASMGIGSANADVIMQQLGQAVVSPKGNVTLIGVDMGIMAKVVNTEKFKASLGAGIGGGVSSDGFFAFAHVDALGKFTMIDNSTLEELKKNTGNTTLNLGIHGGLDFQSFRTMPAVSLDILWNDKIDSLDNALLKMNTILDKLTVVGKDGNITLDLSALPKEIDPIFRSQLQSLQYLVENGDKNMTPSQQNAHAILMRDRFMGSFKTFLGAQPSFKGLSFAGIKFAVVPGALLAGPVFQDISVERTPNVVQSKRKAENKEQTNIMSEFSLTWDNKTRSLIRDKANKTKITLTDGLKLEENDTKVVFPDGKMPKFSLVDTGVSNTLGGGSSGERVLTISPTDSTISKGSDKTLASPEPLASKESLPKNIQDMIQALPINKLIERVNVKNFMKMITSGGDYGTTLYTAYQVPEFKKIFDSATSNMGNISLAEKNFKLGPIILEIDEKLVGDVVTRNFNAAKSDPNAFAEYKKLLRSRGVNVSKLTQATMKIGDIAKVSFDKEGLRDQEINIIAKSSGIKADILKNTDSAMLNEIAGKEKLDTQGSGYMSMARNRKTVRGSRAYETGSYIMKKDLGLSVADNIQAIKNGMGNDLVKVALANLASRDVYKEYKDQIQKVDPKNVKIGDDGRATVNLDENKKLIVDLSSSIVSSALYGDTKMKTKDNEQAVCVNAAVLYEPSIAGTIIDEGKSIAAPEMDITDSDTVMLPEASTNTVTLLGVIATKKPPEKPEEEPKPKKPEEKPEPTPATTQPGSTEPKPKPEPIPATKPAPVAPVVPTPAPAPAPVVPTPAPAPVAPVAPAPNTAAGVTVTGTITNAPAPTVALPNSIPAVVIQPPQPPTPVSAVISGGTTPTSPGTTGRGAIS